MCGRTSSPRSRLCNCNVISYKLVNGFSHQLPKAEGWWFSSGLGNIISEIFSGLEDGGFGKPLVIQRVIVPNSFNLVL